MRVKFKTGTELKSFTELALTELAQTFSPGDRVQFDTESDIKQRERDYASVARDLGESTDIYTDEDALKIIETALAKYQTPHVRNASPESVMRFTAEYLD